MRGCTQQPSCQGLVANRGLSSSPSTAGPSGRAAVASAMVSPRRSSLICARICESTRATSAACSTSSPGGGLSPGGSGAGARRSALDARHPAIHLDLSFRAWTGGNIWRRAAMDAALSRDVRTRASADPVTTASADRESGASAGAGAGKKRPASNPPRRPTRRSGSRASVERAGRGDGIVRGTPTRGARRRPLGSSARPLGHPQARPRLPRLRLRGGPPCRRSAGRTPSATPRS